MGASHLGPDPVLNAIGNVSGSECGLNLSIHFAYCLQAMFFLRICNSLNQDRRSRKLAYILIFSVISIVLIFIILANAFAFAQSHNQTAIVLQVLGCFSAHMFASLFPFWVLGRGGNLLLELRNRRSWGLLCCSSFSLLAAGASLGLLGLPGLCPKYLVGSVNWLFTFGFSNFCNIGRTYCYVCLIDPMDYTAGLQIDKS